MADDTFSGITETFEKIGDAYDRDLRGATSPFRTEIVPSNVTGYQKDPTVKSNVLADANNSFYIGDYRWYTGDIHRRFKDDYYNKIYVNEAIASSSSSKSILGSAISYVGDLASDAINTGIDSVNQIKNSVDNLLNSKKKEAQAKEKKKIEEKMLEVSFRRFLGSFPFAKVYEFKPQDTLGANISTLMAGFKAIDAIVDSSGSGISILKDMINGLNDFLTNEFGLNFKDSSTFANPNTRIYSFPNKMYKNLISGYFTGYYEIPLLDNTDFLVSNGQQGWSSQSFVSRMFGDQMTSTVKDFMSNSIGSGLDIATRPKWSVEGGGDGRDNISMTVTLFNDDLTAVTQNLSFIHSFVGGNMWYQDTIIQKCSSLYDLEVPGRFRYYFCTCNVKVAFKGKVRRFSHFNINSSIMASFTDPSKINMETFNNIPDAYEVTFEFKSLIPNNYNSYVAYLMSNRENEVVVGQRIDNLYKKLADSVQGGVTKGAISRGERVQYKDLKAVADVEGVDSPAGQLIAQGEFINGA